MPRRPRVFIEGGIYHVYNRFARGADILSDPGEAERFIDLVGHVCTRDELTIFAWCVMSNHYHLALRSGPVPLSRTIGSVQARFSQSYNLRHRMAGPWWQSRFNAKLVDDPSYLDQLVLYIHLNPVTAGVVDDPSKYSLSGHRELLRKTPDGLVDVEQTLSLFGDTLRVARRRYIKAMKGARESEWCGELPGGLPWWGREPDRPLAPPPPGAWIDERGLSTGLERPAVTAEEFLIAASSALDFTLDALTAPGSGHELTRIRSMIAALAAERWQLRPAELAPLFGRRNDVVSRWVGWGVEHRQRDAEGQSAYDGLDRRLSEYFTTPSRRRRSRVS